MSISKAKLYKLHTAYGSHQKPHAMRPIGVRIRWLDNEYHILACNCGRHFGWCTKPRGMAYCYNVVQSTTNSFNEVLLGNMPRKYFKHVYAQAKADPKEPAIRYYTMTEQPNWWPK